MPDSCLILWATPSQLRERHITILSEAERQRREAFRRPADRDRFTLASALLRLAVGSRLRQPPEAVLIVRKCPDCDRPHGRPVIEGGGVHVSVSHSGRRVAVALSQSGPVGVDVEEISATRDVLDMMRHVASGREMSRLPVARPDRVRSFYTTWTRKESVLKATGDGLRVPMPELTVSAFDEPARLLAFVGRDDLTELASLRDLRPGAGYVAAVTVLAGVPVEIAESCGADLLES